MGDEVLTLGRPAGRAVAAAVVVLLAGGLAVLALDGDDSSPPVAAATPSPSATPEPTTASATPTTPTPTPTPTTSCAEAAGPFRPRTISVPGVVRDAAVVTPPREADGVPGAPPLTTAGKTVFAWDRAQGIRPGDARGNVLLNAHTWPDGTALGNHLLRGLQQGDRITVHGSSADLCYRVTERIEVLATDGLARYYATDGPPQLALVVCSGRRLGPGVWEKRTVWFASPAV